MRVKAGECKGGGGLGIGVWSFGVGKWREKEAMKRANRWKEPMG